MDFVQQLITKHEGFRCVVYTDTRGKATIGIGFNLADNTAEATCYAHGLDYAALLSGSPITLETAMAIRDDKIMSAKFAADCLIPKFDTLPDDAQAVVIDMIFNMGLPVFSEFRETIAAINAGDFKTAASNMKQSAWYGEVPTRAQEDCQLMLSAGVPS